MTDYDKVAKAIEFIHANFKNQPSLEAVAESVHLSPFHFQRMFKDWAGVSPKKFLQFISLGHARMLLKQNNSISQTAFDTGLSGSSRLHDLFVTVEGMTPGTFKKGGKGIEIQYSTSESLFGKVLVANTDIGICHMSFMQHGDQEEDLLKSLFPLARLEQKETEIQQAALKTVAGHNEELNRIKLHLKGTPFQLKVWEALLKIPSGTACTYGDIARDIKKPKAVRAVGTAIGANPVAYLIPCHRVIRGTGAIGEYHWGSTRKKALLGLEWCRSAESVHIAI